MNNDVRDRYGFEVGDQVALMREAEPSGIVVAIDHLHDLGGTTTCQVVWGAKTMEEALEAPLSDRDIQWTNKLAAVLDVSEANPSSSGMHP